MKMGIRYRWRDDEPWKEYAESPQVNYTTRILTEDGEVLYEREQPPATEESAGQRYDRLRKEAEAVAAFFSTLN